MAHTPAVRLVPGEYNQVARQSSDVEALRRAHATPCTRDEATRMLRELAREHLDAAEALTFVIRFTSRRGRGGRLHVKRREPRLYADGAPVLSFRTGRPRYRMRRTGRTVPYVTLPKVPMDPERGAQYGGIRVGLVLHEFAHVLTIGVDRWHGAVFTAALDMLVAAWAAKEES